jgi:hypothetical protein
MPAPLRATTVQLYADPFASPVTGRGEPVPVAETLDAPAVQVATYAVIGAPPALVGAVKARVTAPGPGVSATSVGAPGTVTTLTGVTVTAVEAGLDPALLSAVTAQLYATPAASPVTVSGLAAPLAVRVAVPAVHEATYPVIAAPPVEPGASKERTTSFTPAEPTTLRGAVGAVTPAVGVAVTAAEAAPAPISLRAATVQLCAVPFVSPITVSGLAVPVAVTVAPAAVQLAV